MGKKIRFAKLINYAFSESILQVGSEGTAKKTYIPDTEQNTGNVSPQSQAIRDRLFEALAEEAAKKKGSRGV